MKRSFSSTLSELRRKRDLSQRRLSADLNISQSLLSHYENGTREPGLPFICRTCEYFGVSADYMLGRSGDGEAPSANSELPAMSELTDLLRELNSSAVRAAALDYIDAALRRISARLKMVSDELFFAELSAVMANAELAVMRAAEDDDTL